MMPDTSRPNLKAVFLLIFLILIIYSNTFDATWHFDDSQNINTNEHIHLENLNPSSLYNTFFFTDTKNQTKLYRPVACFSLALNWYFGKNNVFGYHLVNIIIHCLSTIFLYFFISYILTLPRLNIQNKEKIIFISLLSATLWAINPIQTQAITYIVQRMASLAGMFYILTLLLYIKARCYSMFLKNKILFFIGTIISFFLAVFSKQNAIFIPFSIIMLEIIFIQDLSQVKTRKKILFAFIAIIVLVLFSGVLLFLKGEPLSFLEGYQHRPFTLVQRMLTEPRIVLFYLSLIIYPVPTRLNLDHDVIVSTSLFSPWSTLPSIILIIGLVLYSLYKIKSYPVLSFSVLFYFLNHIIESSILPLELIFEHRNYIPSMFIFLPVSMGFYQILDYYKNNHNKKMYLIFIGFGILIITGFGVGTYVRNMVWFSDKHLWEDCIEKNPDSMRSHHNLAYGHYEKIKEFNKAIKLYEKAIILKDNASIYSKLESLNNLANLYFKQKKFFKAEAVWEKSFQQIPAKKSSIGLCLIYAKKNNLKKALYYITQVTNIPSVKNGYTNNSSRWLLIHGKLLLQNSDYKSALRLFQQSLKAAKIPTQNIYTGMAIAATLNGFPDKGLWFFKMAEKSQPFNTSFYVYFADYYYRTNDIENAKKYIKKYISMTSFDSIQSFAKLLNSDLLTFPVHDDIKPLIKNELRIMYNNLENEIAIKHETKK